MLSASVRDARCFSAWHLWFFRRYLNGMLVSYRARDRREIPLYAFRCYISATKRSNYRDRSNVSLGVHKRIPWTADLLFPRDRIINWAEARVPRAVMRSARLLSLAFALAFALLLSLGRAYRRDVEFKLQKLCRGCCNSFVHDTLSLLHADRIGNDIPCEHSERNVRRRDNRVVEIAERSRGLEFFPEKITCISENCDPR